MLEFTKPQPRVRMGALLGALPPPPLLVLTPHQVNRSTQHCRVAAEMLWHGTCLPCKMSVTPCKSPLLCYE